MTNRTDSTNRTYRYLMILTLAGLATPEEIREAETAGQIDYLQAAWLRATLTRTVVS